VHPAVTVIARCTALLLASDRPGSPPAEARRGRSVGVCKLKGLSGALRQVTDSGSQPEQDAVAEEGEAATGR